MKAMVRDSETPAKNQQIITACAVIHHKFDGVTKIFLAKRAENRKFLPGVFEIPGGHINFGENIVEGLKREIKEELNVGINIGDPFAAFDYYNPFKSSHSIEVVYFSTLLESPNNIILNTEDHSVYEWIAKEEINKVVTPNKGLEDPEFQAVLKAFDLLESKAPDFGF